MSMQIARFYFVSISTQQDLFELLAPSAKAIRLYRVVLTQTSEVGDAQEENLLILFKSGQTITGSGGTVANPVALSGGDVDDASSTVAVNNITKASGGTIKTFWVDGWYVRSPFLWLPTEAERPIISPGTRMTIELAGTPADAMTANGLLVYEVLG